MTKKRKKIKELLENIEENNDGHLENLEESDEVIDIEKKFVFSDLNDGESEEDDSDIASKILITENEEIVQNFMKTTGLTPKDNSRNITQRTFMKERKGGKKYLE